MRFECISHWIDNLKEFCLYSFILKLQKRRFGGKNPFKNEQVKLFLMII